MIISNMNKCLHCEWEWIPRTDNPKVCPKCKTHYWRISTNKINKEVNKPEERSEGLMRIE